MNALNISPIIRSFGFALLAGMGGGFVFGIGTRLSMRGAAFVLHRLAEFSIQGSLAFILGMVFLLIPIGLLYLPVHRFVRSRTWQRGLIFGLVCLLLFGVLFYRGTDTTETMIALGYVPEMLALFIPWFFVYGLVVAAIYAWLDRRVLVPGHQISLLGMALLALPILAELLIVVLAALLSPVG
jgi:hypothetical protein